MTPLYIPVCTLDRGMIYLVQKFQEYLNLSNAGIIYESGKKPKAMVKRILKKGLIMSFRWNKNGLDCCVNLEIYIYMKFQFVFIATLPMAENQLLQKSTISIDALLCLYFIHMFYIILFFFSFIHSYCHSEHKKWWTKNKNQRSSSQLNWIIVSYSDSE